MTPEERNVIGGIFDRLREAAYQPRDPEAERFIADRVREQPYAPYAMAQSMYVLEQAVANLGQQNEQLQREVAQFRQQAQQAQAQPQSGGFLSGLFGGGPRPAASPPASFSQPQRAPMAPQGYAPAPQQAGGPWGGQQGGYAPAQAQAAPQRGGMGFLGTAATAAVGVAGGMIAGNMLMNAFSNRGGMEGISHSLGFGDSKAGESTAPGGGDQYAGAGYEDPSQADQGAYDNASYEDESDADGGDAGDSGGDSGGDWA